MGRLEGGVRRASIDTVAISNGLGLRRPESWRNAKAKAKAVAATQSIVRAILVKVDPMELQKKGIFPGWFLDNLSKYQVGNQSMDAPHRLEVILLGYQHKLLGSDQFRDLGCLALAELVDSKTKDTTQVIRKFRSYRERVKKVYDDGIARMLKGLMPVRARPINAVGRAGTVLRAPKDDAEMERNYALWLAKIEELGGCVTIDEWAPTWYMDAEKSIEDASWEDIPDLDLSYPRPDEGETYADIRQSAPIPAWHPSSVSRLKLWFGGRDWSPWPHSIEDDFWAPVRGDDLSDFLDEHDARLEARYLAAVAIEQAKMAPGTH